MNFLLAELLFENHHYQEAAQQYEQVAYAYTRNSQAAEACYAALIAYETHAKTLEIPCC